jgi:hypothetical protein
MIRSKIASRFKRAATMTFLWPLLTLILHVWSGVVAPTHAQGSRKDDIVFNSRGIPLAGATVRVCAMPASGQPCTPLALIYSDAGLTQALANPTTTDGLGNYFFYASPGKYEIEISGPSITTKQIPNVVLPNDPSSPSFSAVSAFSLNLSGNLTVNGSTTVVGNLASGTLNLSNQSTPPGAAGSGTVNMYTKTADKRLYYKDDTGTETGPILPGAATNVTNTFTASQNFDGDVHFKGLNPTVDVMRYGARVVNTNVAPAIPGITASITAGQTTATLSSASSFQNGDGVTIYGAGATNTMSTPAAPTVTPSLAYGATGTGATVATSGGASTYNYKIVERDKFGALTAASTTGSTTTGQATLGAVTVNITSLSRSGRVVTVTLSSAMTLVANATIYVSTGVSDLTFSGFYLVNSVTDSTHFTYNQGQDTANGASASATGGTVTAFYCNHLVLPAHSATGWEYYIYSDRANPGTFVRVGQSRPLETTWDDFGSPFMDNQTFPSYVPTNPPSSATNDPLTTTIVSGAGTTTLTLANSATNTVSGATILFDDGPAIVAAQAAAASVPIYFPSSFSGSYVINSYTTLPGNTSIWQAGAIVLNETLQIASNTTWLGDIGGSSTTASQFQWSQARQVAASSANPGVYINANGGAVYVRGISFSSSAANGGMALLDDGGAGFNFSFDYCTFGQIPAAARITWASRRNFVRALRSTSTK